MYLLAWCLPPHCRGKFPCWYAQHLARGWLAQRSPGKAGACPWVPRTHRTAELWKGGRESCFQITFSRWLGSGKAREEAGRDRGLKGTRPHPVPTLPGMSFPSSQGRKGLPARGPQQLLSVAPCLSSSHAPETSRESIGNPQACRAHAH